MQYSLKIGKTEDYRNDYGQYWRSAHGQVLIDNECQALYLLLLDGLGCLYQIGLKAYLESYGDFCMISAKVLDLPDGNIGYSILTASSQTDSDERILTREEIRKLPENEKEWIWEIAADIVANDPRIATVQKPSSVQ